MLSSLDVHKLISSSFAELGANKWKISHYLIVLTTAILFADYTN